MNPDLEQMLDLFKLTPDQRRAAAERSCSQAVTAGAGSGKTTTLVARYLGLLGDGLLPRQVVAVTFTDKAAREMRSRIRSTLQTLVGRAAAGDERRRWTDLDARMDSARIGTIHGLCAEILRSHPAEAGLDPQFKVVEENAAATLRAGAIQDSLAWAVNQPGLEELFQAFSLGALEKLVFHLLKRRLDVTSNSFTPAGRGEELSRELGRFFEDPPTAAALADLGRLPPGDGYYAAVRELLSGLDAAQSALVRRDPAGAAAALFTARRKNLSLAVFRKHGPTRDAVKELQERYDDLLNPWLGGKGSQDPAPGPEVEALFGRVAPLVEQLHQHVLDRYRAGLDAQGGLDFDDLEAGAASLLGRPEIRAYWQAEAAALLVDEFQDTNARQRAIIQALAGDQPGRLFVVGDARQSIYRFRGADVTVFTGLQQEITRQGGQAIDLDRTFRAHPGLLAAAGALLAPIMGTEPQPGKPYAIPYAALRPDRPAPAASTRPPFLECLLGSGQDSEAGRGAAAAALARRLLDLKESGELARWDDAALLFRATAVFPVYEQALEEAGIPFATVAGSGFYTRPEVRDLLNLLRAISDPWDDQALAGLLRSPAFGVSDAGLYGLRFKDGEKRSYLEALRGDLSALSPLDQAYARRARAIVAELAPQVDARPVADLLQQIIDHTDFKATLASSAGLPGRARLWRNVDKLVSDARLSQQVRVRAFLEYVASLRDVGGREGEAASEAEGAVRLMTIHKAKGLQFPLVVLADAGRMPNRASDPAFRLGQAWAMPLDKAGAAPLAYNLARWLDSGQAAAEDKRLLYVALTRAQEKLIISGHLSMRYGSLKADGWLEELLANGGILPAALAERAGEWQTVALPGEAAWAVCLDPAGQRAPERPAEPAEAWPASLLAPLVEPLTPHPARQPERAEVSAARPSSPLVPRTPPARVVGEMVHKALQRWCFPGDPALEGLLRTQAQAEDLLAERLLAQAVRQARALLERFQRHPLYREMAEAQERYHEVPYIGTAEDGRVDAGFMDCLYRTPAGWVVLDFKTDRLDDPNEIEQKVDLYRPQLLRYRRAAAELLGSTPGARMCFMNVERAILLREVE